MTKTSRPGLRWTPPLLWAGLILFLTLNDIPSLRRYLRWLLGPLDLSILPGWFDKVEHFVAYLVLGALTAWAARLRAPPTPGNSRALKLLALLLIFAAAQELLQGLTPTRSPSLGDWLANGLGSALGLLLTTHLLRRLASPH